jgi:hypothetical protein
MQLFLNGRNKWGKDSLVACFKSWIFDRSMYNQGPLPCFVIWGSWLFMNKIFFFYGKVLSPSELFHYIEVSYESS